MKQLFLATLVLVSTAAFSGEPPGDPKVSEGLTSTEVQAVIRTNLNQVRHCYEQVLQKSPKAKGKLVADFSIAPDGKVAKSKIASDTLGNAEMGDCVLKKISSWTFPKPQKGAPVEVSYPFTFDPN